MMAAGDERYVPSGQETEMLPLFAVCSFSCEAVMVITGKAVSACTGGADSSRKIQKMVEICCQLRMNCKIVIFLETAFTFPSRAGH